MRKSDKMLILAGSLALATLSADQVLAGAWTQPKGKFYSRISYDYYEADKYFHDGGASRSYSPGDGKKRDIEYEEDLYSLYLEYGVTDKLSLIASLNYKEAEWCYKAGGTPFVAVDKVARTSGLGDQELGLRYRIFNTEKGVFSIQAMYKTPEGYDEDDTGPLDIQRGDSQEDYELRLMYGQSLYPAIPGYFNVELGYRWRTQEPADEFKYLLELGIDFTSRFYGRVKLDGSANLGNGENDLATLSDMDVGGNEVDIAKLDMALGVKINEHFGLEATYRPDLYGESTTDGYTVGIALSFRY